MEGPGEENLKSFFTPAAVVLSVSLKRGLGLTLNGEIIGPILSSPFSSL